ncbi:hypothetical protein [Pelolinea submarina]|uniref:Dolichyl-phosphate-mannose-protein mannosyltransferase n=1 Tax=Pelolinea submarina TaxID=913107 RepID=A0A347ZQC6_9CHLR|nr:hypothetical protein [Pelolinea submarina]REG06163.1 hypothetical protein DFR64_2595 [Pelolinea submarina]BBB47507.1 hypothetical protein Pelsub_P0734 [Pelolinea submarina]
MNHGDILSRLPATSKLRPQKERRSIMELIYISKKESRVVFWTSLIFYLAVGALFNLYIYLGNGDALSRTANAYYVLYSRDPHLAAIGFIWPPLPSLMQLPLLPILKPLGLTVMAGPIISALFGAGSLVMLDVVLGRLKVPDKVRWLLLALTMLHPNYVFLCGSGMAEPIILFFILVVIWGYMQMPYGTRSWVICGAGLAAGFMVRYEALALILGVAIALVLVYWPESGDWRDEMEGRLLAVMVPPAYAVAIWLFLNWMVMDSPLYFLQSEYSLANATDIASNAGVTHPLFLAWNNIFYTISYTFKRLAQQNIAFLIGSVIVLLTAFVKRNRKMIGLLFILFSIPAFTAYQVFSGSLATWLRYWFYAIPYGAIEIGMLYRILQRRWRNLFVGLLVFLFIISIPISVNTMYSDENTGGDMQRLGAYLMHPASEPERRTSDSYYIFRHDAPILAAKVDEVSREGLVMVDANKSYYVILDAKHPERLMITNDTDFPAALQYPQGKVAYILIPEEGNVFSRTYPGIYDGAYDWAVMVYDFPDTLTKYRLFKISPQ